MEKINSEIDINEEDLFIGNYKFLTLQVIILLYSIVMRIKKL